MKKNMRSSWIQCAAVSLVLSGLCLFGTRPVRAADNVLQFSASGQRVTTAAKITTINFSAEAWVKLSAHSSENQIFSQYLGGNSGRFIVAIRAQKAAMFIATWGSGTTEIPLNIWTHIAVTRSGSTCTIYVNGSEDYRGTINANALSDTEFLIGNITSTGPGFRGAISDVRVWNTVRTQSQIANARGVRLTGNENGLIYYWKLNEGIGNTVYDLKSAANGTLNGATWTTSSDLPLVDTLPTGTWTSPSGGNWSDNGNWLDGTIAQGVNSAAYFTNNPPASVTVTNDLGELLLGTLYASAANSYTFTGNTVTLTNAVLASRIASTAGAHTFDLPLATPVQGLSIETLTPAALTFPGVISGPGGVVFNPAANGGGGIALTGANTYSGATTLGCGTLVLDTLNNSGTAGPLGTSSADPANLLLGPGTLRYTGGNATIDRGYTVQAGTSPTRAVVLDTDADLTVGGQVLATSGAFIKTGAGTLSFTYPGWNKYIAHEGGPNALLNIGDNGDSPTSGFSGFTIAQGKVVLGVPGQINIFSNRIDIGAYTTTNASAEHSAELVVNDGTFISTLTLSIGRNNGNTHTAPDGTTSAFTVNGGNVSLSLLAAGHNAVGHVGFNVRPVCQINGGAVEVGTTMNMGEHAGSRTRLNVTGGTLKVNGPTDSIRLGAGAGEGTLTLSGGEIETAQNVQLARGLGDLSKGTLNLDGGTLTAANIARGSGTNAFLNFNGGVFKPHAETTLNGLTLASVRAGGARLDTSLADYTIAQDLLHDDALGATPDGGLIKLGVGTLTFSSTASTFTGPTLVSGGVLRVTGSLPAASPLTVAPDGELLVGGSAEQNLAVASLALEPGGTLGFAFTADGTANDRLIAANSPSLGVGQIALYQQKTDLPFTKNGTYTLITYSGIAPDTAGLTCANPVFGKRYTFAASGGALTVVIATDAAGASVWNVDASGDWGAGANWTVPQPGAAGSAARFDDAVSGPVAIATAGQSAGALYFNSPFTYTLGGAGLTLDNGAADAQLAIESGTHAFTAPLTLASDTSIAFHPGTGLTLAAVNGAAATLEASGDGTLALTSDPHVQALALDGPTLSLANTMTVLAPIMLLRSLTVAPADSTTVTLSGTVSGSGGLTKAGSSILVPAAANTYVGATAVNAGTLRVATLATGGAASPLGASSSAAGNLVLGPATLHITGPAATDRGYTVRTVDPSRAAVLRVDDDVTFGGQILADSGPFLKTGPGTVTYTFQGANVLNRHEVSGSAGLQNIGEYGDGPSAGITGFTVTQGKVMLGAPGQTNTVNGHIDIGLYTTTQAGQETAGELVLNDGVLNCNNTVSVGRQNGTTTTAPGGISSCLTVNGGEFVCGTLAMGSGNKPGFNARPVVKVTGGLVNVGGGYLSVGESLGSQATLLVSGGTVNISRANSTLRIGGGPSGGEGKGGNGTVRLWGTGEIEVSGEIEVGTGQDSESEFHLEGGRVSARAIIGLSGTRKEFWFNGGTFLPHTANQTMSGLTAATVSTNGAWFDTSLADGFTVEQNLLHDPVLGTVKDGGLVKLGTHSLSLTGAANTFNGRVDLREGLLRARLGTTNDLAVAAGAAFDALGERCTVGDLTGTGLLTNGVIAVTGRLDPGTHGTPAGATITVENLALAAGATLACTWATNALGNVTNDFVTVSGILTAEGPGRFDLGRSEENPIPVPFSLTVLSYNTVAGSFTGWRATGTGLPAAKAFATVVTAADGLVTVTVRYSGTVFMLK